jgi:hypothetical protein
MKIIPAGEVLLVDHRLLMGDPFRAGFEWVTPFLLFFVAWQRCSRIDISTRQWPCGFSRDMIRAKKTIRGDQP